MSLDYTTTMYPKNMSYHIERIVNYSKQPIRVSCDRTGVVNHRETIRFKLPPNSLIDLDSLYWYFTFTAAAPTAGSQFFPRNSASIIDTLSVYANGQLIDQINNYHHLFNALADATCGQDYNRSGLRYLENTDPSLKFVYDTATGGVTHLVTSATANIIPATRDILRPFIVRSWLGFCGSASTKIIDTSLLGDVIVEILLAEPSVMFKGHLTDVGNEVLAYTIDGSSTYMSVNRITFGDSVYYDLLRNIVLQNGLQIAYNTYTSHRGASYTKAVGTQTFSFNVNANHLTKLIATVKPSNYQAQGKLFNTDTNAARDQSWCTQLGQNTCTRLFNQSRYFQKDGSGISTVQWDINSVSQYPQPLKMEDIFTQNMIALNQEVDTQACCHAGCDNIYSFALYYFLNILSFEHIQNTDAFVLGGLDGKASAISCKWTLNYDAVGLAGDAFPLVFAENQKVLNILSGQQLMITA
jgi:hypothetical protein